MMLLAAYGAKKPFGKLCSRIVAKKNAPISMRYKCRRMLGRVAISRETRRQRQLTANVCNTGHYGIV